MKLNILVPTLVSILTMPIFATAQTSSVMAELAPKLDATMRICPQKIWPNYSWKNQYVIIIENQQQANIWDGATGAVRALDIKEISSSTMAGVYDFPTFNGKESVVGNCIESQKYGMDRLSFFGLIIHEGFHHFAQSDWTHEGGSRGTVFPLKYEPRLYRSLLYSRLKEYFLSSGNKKESLQMAAYWYRQWIASAPEEFKNSMDLPEGTARYAELMAEKVALLGCGVSDQDLLKAMQSKVSEAPASSVSGQKFALDSEGYDIGSLASLILQLIDHNPNWPALAKQGQSPLVTLLQSQTSVSDIVPAELRKQFEATGLAENNQVNSLVAQDFTNLFSKDFVRFVPVQKSAPSTYSPDGFFVPASYPNLLLMPLREMSFQYDGMLLKTSDKKVFMAAGGMLSCQNGYQFFTLIPKASLKKQGNIFDVQMPSISGQFRGTEVVDANGFTWICGQ